MSLSYDFRRDLKAANINLFTEAYTSAGHTVVNVHIFDDLNWRFLVTQDAIIYMCANNHHSPNSVADKILADLPKNGKFTFTSADAIRLILLAKEIAPIILKLHDVFAFLEYTDDAKKDLTEWNFIYPLHSSSEPVVTAFDHYSKEDKPQTASWTSQDKIIYINGHKISINIDNIQKATPILLDKLGESPQLIDSLVDKTLYEQFDIIKHFKRGKTLSKKFGF